MTAFFTASGRSVRISALLLPLIAALLSACGGNYKHHGEYQRLDDAGTPVEVLELKKDSTFWMYGKDIENPSVPAIWSSEGKWMVRNDTVVLISHDDLSAMALAEGSEWKHLGFSSEESDYIDYFALPLKRTYAVNDGFLYSPETQTTLKKPGAGEG